MENSLKLGLSQKLTQTLKMTPEMQLAIKILQLNSVELKNQIVEVLETNPVVELDENAVKPNELPLEKLGEKLPEAGPPSREFKESGRDDFGVDWQRYIEDTEHSEFKVSSGSYNRDEETSFENFVSKKSNLREHLTTQLREVNLNPTEQKIGEYLIGLIDRNGYLRHTSAQISELLKVEPVVIDRVRKAIQTMDPVGVGAYDLRECLLIQAAEEGYVDDAVTTVISTYLEDLGQNRIHNIVKASGYDLEDIVAAIEVIKGFNPKPGASFPSTGDEIYVSPEVFVEKDGDDYVVTMNERDLPRLRINNLYKDAMKHRDTTEKETYEFIRNKLEAARSFLKYVDKRQETILSVTRSICEVQRDFLDFGILHLKPLTLQDVAGMAGVHESTVSRATSGKYVQTPRGLFELKFFFSGAARTQSGEDVSTMAVKKRIDDLVKAENPKKPLSDSHIVDMLKKDGIFLARRTVAKYRIELNIPSSSARKQH
ncbi:MAG TPA: RNA polymerase factor sigma-54 [Candidatus Rifleibacterium sp.]|nr:RNA polymerase factor sigma-54 [Candidatus Rifleibacterium sp.]HPT47254.1 RNA polymerase factor sigma-54 [Candidatus Rifleibacterium sp.]